MLKEEALSLDLPLLASYPDSLGLEEAELRARKLRVPSGAVLRLIGHVCQQEAGARID